MKLSEEQILAKNHKDGPCLVLAVPGSGKTTMLLARIEELSKVVSPKKILSLSFSRAQVQDMKKRYQGPESNFFTIHAFSYLIVRNYLKREKRQVNVLEDSLLYNKEDLVRDIYYRVNGRRISREDLANFFTATSYMVNKMEDLSYLDDLEVKNAGEIFLEYEDFKRKRHLFDFDDMLTFALKLLEEDEKTKRQVQRAYRYVQLDEGQDTSLLQFKIIERLVAPDNNLMVVADDDQSIYAFRAAEPDYLLNFKDHYPNGKILKLEKNYRSGEKIVASSLAFIGQNQERFEKEGQAFKGEGSEIFLKALKTSSKEYSYIKNHLKEGMTSAILFRNNISAISMMDFLIKDGIDFSITTESLDFFDSRILRDLEDVLYFAENLKDGEAFKKISGKIRTYLKREDLEKLSFKGRDEEVFDFYEREGRLEAYKLKELKARRRDFKKLSKMTFENKLSYIYSSMGYRDYLKTLSAKYGEERQNKLIFMESLLNFSKGLRNFEDFHKKEETFQKYLREDEDSNLILSTIHKSKGLEYDQVFLLDLVDGEFPTRDQDGEGERHLEEERRIFYVGLTRAKKEAHLLSLKERSGERVAPSPFYLDMEEILKDLQG